MSFELLLIPRGMRHHFVTNYIPNSTDFISLKYTHHSHFYYYVNYVLFMLILLGFMGCIAFVSQSLRLKQVLIKNVFLQSLSGRVGRGESICTNSVREVGEKIMAKNRTLLGCKISVLLIMIYDSLENYTQEWDDFQIGKEVQVEYFEKMAQKVNSQTLWKGQCKKSREQ